MLATFALVLGITATAVVQRQDSLPPHLRERGRGVRTSDFQTYVRRHQLLLLPAASYLKDHDFEYNPLDWGFGTQTDLRGELSRSSAQLLIVYGVTDWLAFELEGSYLSARFEKDARDTTATPARIRESGLGDFAGQIRVRFGQERGRRPEIWGSLEVIPRNMKSKVLIGDKITDVKGEFGLTRGFHFGTMTLKTTVEYNHGDHHWDLGETSLEYLRRLSPDFRLLLAIEGGEGGAPDEWVFVTAGQWRIASGCFLKFANGFGLMSKSTDWEPQLGILLEVP